MSFQKTKKTTHQNCRSLLQKAIRRGYEDIAQKTAYHLISIGDNAWIRSRCVVICAEECWPHLEAFNYTINQNEIISNVKTLSRLTKNKDAAGLGSLGFALSKGDQSVFQNENNKRPIKIIAEAIVRPDAFWQWLSSLPKPKVQKDLVDHLISLHKKAGWPWDKAFIQAAGYLFLHNPVETVEETAPYAEIDFPFWVAMDKHTSDGKNAIRDIAKEIGLPYRQLGWISFYMESGLTNHSKPAYWWEREKEWRLSKVGINALEAEDIWKEAKLKIIERLRSETEELRKHINPQDIASQQSLFREGPNV